MNKELEELECLKQEVKDLISTNNAAFTGYLAISNQQQQVVNEGINNFNVCISNLEQTIKNFNYGNKQILDALDKHNRSLNNLNNSLDNVEKENKQLLNELIKTFELGNFGFCLMTVLNVMAMLLTAIIWIFSLSGKSYFIALCLIVGGGIVGFLYVLVSYYLRRNND